MTRPDFGVPRWKSRRRSQTVQPEPSNPTDSKDIGDEVAQRFKPVLALFSSVAAVSAGLLFAGFLSDYGAYQLAGLPRLSFSITALAEAGADTVIDSLALLAKGVRLPILLTALLALVLIWAGHHRPKVARWVASRRLYRLCWLGLLMLAMLLFAAMVDRAQRSLSGEMHSPSAIQRALQKAYADDFPDPLQRQLALEREGFELHYLRPLNLAPDLEALWSDRIKPSLTGQPAERAAPLDVGLPLRVLPESRRDARHIYGWLALSLLLLLMALVLIAWWGAHQSSLAAVALHAQPASDGHPVLGDAMDGVIQRLLRPITWLLLIMCICLLPLNHGVLARESLGGETMMIYLKAEGATAKNATKRTQIDGKGTEASKEEFEQQKERPVIFPEASGKSWPQARFDCELAESNALDAPVRKWEEAQRDFAQARSSDTAGYKQSFAQLGISLQALTEAVIETKCAETMNQFWAARPEAGLMAQAPELGELYRKALLRLNTGYGLRQGTILSYSRDGQALTLVDSIVPRHGTQQGLWSVQAVEQKAVGEAVVLPDLRQRNAHAAAVEVGEDRDNTTALKRLIVAPSTAALELLLPLVKRKALNANHVGVIISSMGTMAWASTPERPDLSTEGIVWLAQIAHASATATADAADESTRGAALTALHLTRNPYAAHLLVRDLDLSKPAFAACDKPGPRPIQCLGQTVTSTGYLLGALYQEAARVQPPPQNLKLTLSKLEWLLGEYLTQAAVSDEYRGAACTAVGKSGAIEPLSKTQGQRFMEMLQVKALPERPFSSGACIIYSNRLGLPDAALRRTLKEIALYTPEPGVDAPTRAAAASHARAAYVALFEMGLGNEADFVFKALLQIPKETSLGEVVTKTLDDVDDAPMAKRLSDCALDTQRPEAQRVLCLNGFTYMDNDYAGDDGTAAGLLAMTASSSGRVREAACGALKVLIEHDSRYLQRRQASDTTLQSCL
jgi:hypothetical protein